MFKSLLKRKLSFGQSYVYKINQPLDNRENVSRKFSEEFSSNMSEKKTTAHQKQQRRHKKSEINLALFLFQASYQGNSEDLNEVLSSDKIKPEKKWLVLNARDAEGVPILINCIKGSVNKDGEAQYLECLKILVQQQLPVDVTDSTGRTVIHWAVELKEIEMCRFLLENGAPVNKIDSEKKTPIHIAIGEKSIDFVKLLCEYKTKEMLETVDNMGRTPLCHALFVGSVDIFVHLLKCGANPNDETNNGKKLVAHCIENINAKEFLNVLLKHNVQLFPNDSGRFSMIHLAACHKNPTALQIIASHCTNVELDWQDVTGKTPLMYAVYNQLVDNVKILLQEEVDTSISDNDGKTVLHHTDKNNASVIVEMLLDYDSSLLYKVSNSSKNPVHSAIIANNCIVLRAMLDHGADPQMLDDDGHTLAHYAAEYSALDCLSELTSVGVPINKPDKYGTYPIHYAVRLESEENIGKKRKFLEKLIKEGVKLDVADGQGLQAIHWAVSMGNGEALKLLLIEETDVNAVTSDQLYSPLHLACLGSHLKCLQLLLRQPNIMVDQKDKKGYTPLIYACSMKDSKYSELLLNAGANPESAGNDGKTAAHNASANSTVDCLWLLSLKKTNFNVKNNVGEYPIHVACMNPEDACLRFLLARKCDVNASFNGGCTALHIAVTGKNFSRTKLLLEHGANCNVILYGKEKFTPLDIALENSDYAVIKLLQKYNGRTGHSIVSHAVLSIQHWWKKWKKKHRGHTDHSNNSSMCTSSNASESVSVLAERRYNPKPQINENIKVPPDILVVDETANEEGLSDSASQSNTEIERTERALIPDYDDWVSGKKDREHEERIKRGEMEIQAMRQLMKDTEKLLYRAKNLNKEAEDIINSEALRLIKQSNKLHLEKKREMESINKKQIHPTRTFTIIHEDEFG